MAFLSFEIFAIQDDILRLDREHTGLEEQRKTIAADDIRTQSGIDRDKFMKFIDDRQRVIRQQIEVKLATLKANEKDVADAEKKAEKKKKKG